jgi:hopanoid biosynthesis associated protein HpnK
LNASGPAARHLPDPHIVISADDFGLSEGVNEAVEIAHREGILGQASLMVAAPSADDAVRRAHAMPSLNVGLHLVLVDGQSVLGHAALPSITLADGRFGADQVARGFRYFFSPRARRELAAEIRAQFEAFRATGLALHHADAHKHMHLHPVVGRLLIDIGREYGLPRIRVPAEPPAVLKACGARPGIGPYALYLWSFMLRRQARKAGLSFHDHVFGIFWSGQMTSSKLELLLKNYTGSSAEIYFHPATKTDPQLTRLMPDYLHELEFKAIKTRA